MASEPGFGGWLRRRRRAMDLTQAELAQRAGCSVVTIRKLEAGERRPSKQIAARLADCLKISPNDRAELVAFARGKSAGGTVGGAEEPMDLAAWPPAHPQAARLPAPITGLIGREQELAAVRNQLLRHDARLVTLVGPPGIGKTRLAVAVGEALAEAFADGVCFVGLASIQQAGQAAALLATGLGLKESGDRPWPARLIDHLKNRRLLLILDNFEHVLSAAPLIADLLAACPGLKILTTSRAALRVRGEHLFPIPPLLLPDTGRLPSLEMLAQFPAVALFVERARAANPAFRLNPDNAAAVASILVQLDGLPLAIELAAARCRSLSLDDLAARLNRRLEVLVDGPRDLPRRHASLRAAIEASDELLEDSERTLLARLAVFQDSFTLAAAEAVAADHAEHQRLGTAAARIGSRTVLDALAALVDHSLVQQRGKPAWPARYLMLETIREYALEQLFTRGEMQTWRRRHAEHYLALAEQAEPELRGPEQFTWFRWLEEEHNNQRAALGWALEQRKTLMALRMGAALWHFWELHSHFGEGRMWLAAALEQSQAAAELAPSELTSARARALTGAGKLANDQGESVAALGLCLEALKLWQLLGAAGQSGSITTLYCLSIIEQSLGHYPQAAQWIEKCLAVSQALQNRIGLYIALYNQAEIAAHLGDDTRAEALHQESLTLKREQGDAWSIAWSLASLARLAANRNDHVRAMALYQDSLRLRWAMGDLWSVAESIRGLAEIASRMGQAERAARLFGAMAGLFDKIGVQAVGPMSDYHKQIAAGIRSQLGDAAFTQFMGDGRRFAPEEAVAVALD